MASSADRTPDADRRLLGGVLGWLVLGVLVSGLLPRIALDGVLADAVVRLTDTASWTQLTPITVLVVLALASRPGISGSRRTREAITLAVVMLVALAGNAQLNEHVIKPALAVPRPNITHLAETGVLGPGLPDAAAFYATGDKGARRLVLGELLTEETTPQLSDLVRAHWIHETGYSFPSGHTTAAVTFAALLAAIGVGWLSGWRRFGALYVLPIWAVGIAASRTLLEVHTAWDVIAGTVAGLVWGLLAFVVAQRVVAGQRAAS